MRWLVVSPYLPHARIGHGGGTAVLQVCQALARVHETSLLCFRRESEMGLESELEAAGVKVHTVGFRSDQARGASRLPLVVDRVGRVIAARRHGRPLMVEKYDRQEMHRALDECLGTFQPDVVQVEYGFMAPYASHSRGVARAPHVILNTHELGSLVRLRRAAVAADSLARRRHGADVARWARHEAGFGVAADTITCVTEQDRTVLAALTDPARLITMPLGTDVASLPTTAPGDAPSPPHLLFVGSFRHPPNVEGMRIFLERDFGRILEAQKDVVLDVVGADLPDSLRSVAAPFGRSVVFHGFVDDLAACFDRASVFVVPLVSGGGIKIKVLEAMGRGAAVVSTPIGLEGIDDAGQASRRVTGGDDFATAVLELLDDDATRADLGARARTWIEKGFGWDAIVRRLTERVQSSSQARQGGTGRSNP